MKRRNFVKKSSLLTAAGLAGVTIFPDCTNRMLNPIGTVSPNDMINLGFIGLGMRGRKLIEQFNDLPGVKILAVSDIDDKRIAKAVNMVNSFYGPNEKACASYKDFRELLDRKDIDGVIVATPDHWHAIQTILAIKMGKDVYCEKPVTHTISEGRRVIDVATKYGRIVQVGSQQRSHKAFRDAVNYVRNGYIGEVKSIKERSSPKYPIPFKENTTQPPEYMDWDMWMGPSKYYDYNEMLLPDVSVRKFPAWRAYKEWGGGGICDLGAHMFDIAQWGLDMDSSGPVEVMPAGFGDTEALTYIYANGVVMRKEDFGMGGMSVLFEGTEGWVAAGRWWIKTCDELKGVELKEKNGFVDESDNHLKNWLDCMRSRKQPICNPEVGHRSATICNMAVIAKQVGKPLKWDPVKEKFNHRTANKLQNYTYRGNWSLDF